MNLQSKNTERRFIDLHALNLECNTFCDICIAVSGEWSYFKSRSQENHMPVAWHLQCLHDLSADYAVIQNAKPVCLDNTDEYKFDLL